MPLLLALLVAMHLLLVQIWLLKRSKKAELLSIKPRQTPPLTPPITPPMDMTDGARFLMPKFELRGVDKFRVPITRGACVGCVMLC